MGRCTSFAVACLAATIAIAAVATGASAAAPEFGRCIKEAGKGEYSNSGCTLISPVPSEYAWKAGPGPKSHFKDLIESGTSVSLNGAGGSSVTCTGATGGGEIANAKEVAGVIFKFNGCEASNIACESAGAGEGEIITRLLSGVIGAAPKGKVAEELRGPGEIIAEFACGPIQAILRGASVHKITTNKMVRKTTEKYTGILAMTLLQTFEEKIEANSVV